MKKQLTIAMAWWWTGWHVFPIQSLIEYLYMKEDEKEKIKHIYWFWKKGSLEQKCAEEIRSACPDISFVPIVSGKYRRETWFSSRMKNIRDIFLFLFGCIQSFYFLLYYKIDVIFCKWWYVALPVVLMWALLKKRIFVHESDVRPGLVNKISARFAEKVFTWFDKVLPKSITVGQILSEHILVWSQTDKRESKVRPSLQGIDRKKTLIIVIGGSQWSKRLYFFLKEILEKNKKIESELVFCIVLGQLNQELAEMFEQHKNVYTFDFLSQKDMGILYEYGDIALTRAGTTSLAEQKLYDMKICIVPIPRTHDQYENAKWYMHKYKDVLLDQNNPDFISLLEKTLEDHIWYKKTLLAEDKSEKIHEAKDIIWKTILW